DQPLDACRVGQRGVRQRALHAQRPVDGERVDPQALERLHQRRAGAPVEGDALLDLRRTRVVLDEHDVGLRMAGPEHRHEVAARTVAALLQLAREVVQLADRPLEVLLADLVVGDGHAGGKIGRAPGMSLLVHQDLRAARRTRRSREAARAALGTALVCRNFSAWTYRREAGVRTMSASRSASMNSSGPSKSGMRIRTEPSPCATCASEPAPAGTRYLAAKRAASSLNSWIATRGLKISIASTSSSTAVRCS